MSTATVITAQRYSQGFTYEAYLNQLSDTRQRFAEHEAAFLLASTDAQFFKDTLRRFGNINVVAIVEDWCPDVHRGLPIMAAIAQASGMHMRVFPREKNLVHHESLSKPGKVYVYPGVCLLRSEFESALPLD